MRMIRGGGWDVSAEHCRSSISFAHAPTDCLGNVGFRIALVHVDSTINSQQPVEDDRIMTMDLSRDVELKMVKIEAGTFKRGTYTVTLTKDYWLGMTEVTQGQYAVIMEGVTNEMGKECNPHPSWFNGDSRLPVEQVSWDDARVFCRKLNEKLSGQLPDGYHFDLPTEAQWEYAARGGNKSKNYIYSGGNQLDNVGWYYENSGKSRLNDKEWKQDNLIPNECKPQPVGTKGENELGLYDMSGNVFEWCLDRVEGYLPGSVKNSSGSSPVLTCVYRGGSWLNKAEVCLLSSRYSAKPSEREAFFGFRVALVPVP